MRTTQSDSAIRKEPPFWTPELSRIPWCNEVRSKAAGIRTEILELIANFKPFMPYPKYSVPNYGSLYDNTWDAFPLSVFQGEHIELSRSKLSLTIDPIVRALRNRLPITSSTISPLESQGHLRNVFVSRLLPGSVINPHRGWTADFLRIHLCLKNDPGCVITVGEEKQGWILDELLAFKDGGPYLHAVNHQGTHERIILSYDLSIRYIAQFIPEIQPNDASLSAVASDLRPERHTGM